MMTPETIWVRRTTRARLKTGLNSHPPTPPLPIGSPAPTFIAGDLGYRFAARLLPGDQCHRRCPEQTRRIPVRVRLPRVRDRNRGLVPPPLVVRIRLSARRFLKAFTPSRLALVAVA